MYNLKIHNTEESKPHMLGKRLIIESSCVYKSIEEKEKTKWVWEKYICVVLKCALNNHGAE